MPLRRPVTAIRQFLRTEAAGGYVLMAAATAAMVVANSALSETYTRSLHQAFAGLSVRHWINDGLMALFFLLVGLEIKRELIDGELSSWPRRILPGAAALGGMVLPALVYLAVNHGLAADASSRAANASGWAIPAATDIAFALGVFALLGKRVPASLKLLLTAIAIIDDLGAILIIAIAYTASLDLVAIAVPSPNASAAMNRLMVKPMPQSSDRPQIWRQVAWAGASAKPSFTIAAMAPNTPSCLPRTRPSAMPSGTGANASPGAMPRRSTPALAKPKIGTMTNALTGESACSRRSKGVVLASGVPLVRRIGIVKATATPANVAWMPESSTATQMPAPMTR